MSNYQLTTRELMEKMLNGEIPIPRSNPKGNESTYYYLKSRGNDRDESVSDMEVINVPNGVDPYMFQQGGNTVSAPANPTNTMSEVDKWLAEAQAKMAKYGQQDPMLQANPTHPFYDMQGNQVYEWCDPRTSSNACAQPYQTPSYTGQVEQAAQQTPSYGTYPEQQSVYSFPDFSQRTYQPSIRDMIAKVLENYK